MLIPYAALVFDEASLQQKLDPEVLQSIREIASRLRLGEPKGATTNLHEWMRGTESADSAQGTLNIQ